MRYSVKAVFSFCYVVIRIFTGFLDDANAYSDSTRLTIDPDRVQKVHRPLTGHDSSYVLVALMNPNKSDSILMNFRQVFLDSLTNRRYCPDDSTMVFQFVIDDSAIHDREIHGWNNSPLLRFGKRAPADLVLSGIMTYDNERKLCYQPKIILLKQHALENRFYHDQATLSGNICQLSQFDLPGISVNQTSHVLNFLRAFFMIREQKYSDAISKLTQDNSMPGYFYLGESYLLRGIINEENSTSAMADWDSCRFSWQKCLAKSATRHDSICVLNNLGVCYQFQGNVDSALAYFSRAHSLLTDYSSHKDFVRIYNNLGNIYLRRGQWTQALDIFHANIQALEQSRDSLKLALTYENLGHIYQLMLQRAKAITYHTKALEIRRLVKDAVGVVNSLNFLGDIYQEREEYDNARDYFKQGLVLSCELHSEPQVADSYDRLGQVFQGSGNLDSALFYYQKSFASYELLGANNGMLTTIMHQASIYYKQKNFDQALSLYQKAIQLADDTRSKLLRAQIYDRIGDIYNNLDNLAQAYEYYQQSVALYEEVGNYETVSLILYNMGLIKLKQNNYPEGFPLLKRAIQLDEEHGFNNLSSEKDFLRELEAILNHN